MLKTRTRQLTGMREVLYVGQKQFYFLKIMGRSGDRKQSLLLATMVGGDTYTCLTQKIIIWHGQRRVNTVLCTVQSGLVQICWFRVGKFNKPSLLSNLLQRVKVIAPHSRACHAKVSKQARGFCCRIRKLNSFHKLGFYGSLTTAFPGHITWTQYARNSAAWSVLYVIRTGDWPL